MKKQKREIRLKMLAASKGIRMPDPQAIVNPARMQVVQEHNPAQIKENFDHLIHKMESSIHKLYLEKQREYGKQVLQILIEEMCPSKQLSFDEAKANIGNYFDDLDGFFLSLAQSRKSRAGDAFEGIIHTLFRSLNYPFDEQQVINGKPDFLLPSRKHYDTHAMDCIIFTAKRTLRERWRQIVTEGTRGLGFFLATIDDKVSQNQLEEMKRNRIYLVCPATIKNAFYNDAVNVITFSRFFEDHLDPAMVRWKRNGAL